MAARRIAVFVSGTGRHLENLARLASTGEMDFEAFDAAQEVCLVHLEGVTLGFDQVDQTEFEDQLLAFATCMRDNGIDMDDPDLSGFEPGGDGEPGVIDPFGDVDSTDPAFQSALEACEEHLSGFGPPQS